jgi:hypothetical protein
VPAKLDDHRATGWIPRAPVPRTLQRLPRLSSTRPGERWFPTLSRRLDAATSFFHWIGPSTDRCGLRVPGDLVSLSLRNTLVTCC